LREQLIGKMKVGDLVSCRTNQKNKTGIVMTVEEVERVVSGDSAVIISVLVGYQIKWYDLAIDRVEVMSESR